jgi:transposase
MEFTLDDKPQTKLENFSKEELIKRYGIAVNELERLLRENYQLRGLSVPENHLNLMIEGQLNDLQDKFFKNNGGSERYKKRKEDKTKEPLPPKPKIKKPSERYPNIPVVEKTIAMDPVPNCNSCGKVMVDSGMTEDSEQLTVIPKRHEIELQKRVKYRCSCHSCIETAPAPARIKEGSSYSDAMMLDVALTKYCDLIPIERYAAMAERSNSIKLPRHSLIECTHHVADFVEKSYVKVEEEVLLDRVIFADETPHRMLEGSEKKSWYLWGFSSYRAMFLSYHDTRSGDVSAEILLKSKCEILMSDAYTGYNKSVRIVNEFRLAENLPLIVSVHCNSHARRYFYKSHNDFTKESDFFLDHYHEIYTLEAEAKGKSPDQVLEIRAKMLPRFEAMKEMCLESLMKFSVHDKIMVGMKYFLENYNTLTKFLTDAEIPIDNNPQERGFRGHVLGRKTWYGTHSERGAKTAAILFTLCESCKLIGVNPREYFEHLIKDVLAGKEHYTPWEFKKSQKL